MTAHEYLPCWKEPFNLLPSRCLKYVVKFRSFFRLTQHRKIIQAFRNQAAKRVQHSRQIATGSQVRSYGNTVPKENIRTRAN